MQMIRSGQETHEQQAQRAQTIARLRIWAQRAQSEAQYADTQADARKWQEQAGVLSSVANFLDDQGSRLSDFAIWSQVVADREKALANWQAQQSGPEVARYAGQVEGYDLALTALRDVDGKIWPRNDPHVG
ncbi:MAG TPA: hypothetical protein VKQ36_08545 [Ktedonobacterales bacterium]|nr:hypothetical protein [Ktedonobacterales bacterium]